MFEKEAEVYALSNFGFRGKNSQRVLTAKIDYQYGAEFGYHKANEWHYVKDGFPSENAMLLLARKTVNGVQALIGYYKSNQFEIFNEKSCKMQNIDSVYAWKEIVLPELKES